MLVLSDEHWAPAPASAAARRKNRDGSPSRLLTTFILVQERPRGAPGVGPQLDI